MTILVDTSALYAVLDEDDRNHAVAGRRWRSVLGGPDELLTHTYVVIETAALVQRRLGAEACRALVDELLPVLRVHNVTSEEHAQAIGRWRQDAGSRLSLVDVTSFVVMGRLGIDTAFAFDRDFIVAGYQVLA